MPGGCDYLLPSPLMSNRVPHPITLLPTEILSEIMCYLPLFFGRDAPSIHSLSRDLDPSRRYTRDGPIRTPHWVAVSHVCHRWREIALKCKALWTVVPLVSVSWAQRALTLSHPHPIILHIDSKDKSLDKGYLSVDALCLALMHIERIRKIHIHSPWGTRHGDRIMDVVFGTLFRGAPSLEELDLAPDPPFLARPGLDGNKRATEPELQALRVIRLEQCFLPADCVLFHPGLTHLRLSGTRAVWPAMEPLLSTLALVPKLQVLELYGVLPTAHSSPHPASTADRRILPLLHELHLGGTTQGVLAVLQALNLSESVSVHVSLPDTPAEDGSPSRMLGKLRGKQGLGPESSHTSH
ncbi:hypothetical protein EI94DRAFT_1743147 [Lactarius quietus]|nr:hypothetical protein EI94DRAFT_1743147 [Lactarius quietus]